MNYFLDTEFVEDGFTIMPISLGLVCEDNRSLYVEFEHDEEKACAHEFVRANVLPHLLGRERHTKLQARATILDFLGLPKHPAKHPAKHLAESKKSIMFWAYYADYDWVVWCQIFGTMMDLPEALPKFCMDLQQWWWQLGCPKGVKPPKSFKTHNALADADWNFSFYKKLEAYVQAQES